MPNLWVNKRSNFLSQQNSVYNDVSTQDSPKLWVNKRQQEFVVRRPQRVPSSASLVGRDSLVEPPVVHTKVETQRVRSAFYNFEPYYPEKITELLSNLIKYNAKSNEFIYNKDSLTTFIKKSKKSKKRIPGCYIIFDMVELKYYVGQAIDLARRMQDHITGTKSGGKDIDVNIVDNNHPFLVMLIFISLSGYFDLNDLEKGLIDAYDSTNVDRGYNKTAGGS